MQNLNAPKMYIASWLLLLLMSCGGEKQSTNQNNMEMTTMDFSTTILVDQKPEEVFQAIMNIRGWWSEEIEGGTSQLNDEFFYHYKDIHLTKMKLVEVVPSQKLVWLVLENQFSFTQDQREWVGNRLVFEITPKNGQTEVRFTQEGLVPDYECYKVCHDGWTNYIEKSLYDLITTGKGSPNPKDGEGFNAELADKWKINR